MIYIYLFFIVLNLWIGNTKKKNYLILFISFVFTIILMGLNTYNSDYIAYKGYYTSQQYDFAVEVGFRVFSSVCYFGGLSYHAFLCIYFSVALLIGGVTVKRISGNYHFCLAFYLLTAIFLDACEIRQTMAYFIAALALTYLADNKKGKYILLILLASSFQKSALALLPLVILYRNIKEYKKILMAFFCIICIICIIVFLNGNRIPGLKEILSIFLSEDKLVYFDTQTRLGFLLFFFANFSNMCIVWYMKKYYPRMQNKNEFVTKLGFKYVDVSWNMLLYLCFAMPLCMINSEFLRYFRFIVLPVIMIGSFTANYKSEILKRKNKFVLNKMDVAFFCYLICYTISFQHFRVLNEVLSNNMLL